MPDTDLDHDLQCMSHEEGGRVVTKADRPQSDH